MAAVLMRGRGEALPITIAFAIILTLTVILRIDISPVRDLLCDSVFRDAGQCAGERFLDPSPFAVWLPSDWFVWDSVRSGHLPLWERLQGGGYSPLLTLYNGVFHPVRWIAALFTRDAAPTVIIIVALYAGFLGMYTCAREIGVSTAAAFLAAFAFAFGGGVVSFAEFSGCLLPVMHLPWIVFLLKRASRTRRSIDFALLATAIALMFVSGHPAFVFCATVAIAGVAITDAFITRRAVPAILGATSGVVAVFLAAFALLPPFVSRDELWSYKTQTYAGSSYGILQWPAWLRLIGHAAVEHPFRYVDVDFWPYIGIPAIVLALAGLYASFRATHHLGIMAMLFGFLLLAFPGPWMAEIADVQPVKYLKAWYMMGEVAFFLALAIAIGFDHLRGAGVRARWLAVGFAFWIVVIYGWRDVRVFDPIRWRPLPETAALRFLRTQPGRFRVTGLLGQTHTPNSSRNTGIEDIRTSQPVLLQRYVTWWSLVDRDVRRRAYPTTRITDRLTSPLVAEIGVEYVLQSRFATWLTFHSDTDPAKRDREHSTHLDAFPLVFRSPSLEIRRNPMPIRPRAHFAERVAVVRDAKAAEALLVRDPSLPLRASVVENATPLDIPAVARGSVTVHYPSDSTVVLDVRSDTGGLVVLHDTYANGWRAGVDGQSAPLLPVGVLSRGVVVPAGLHRIEMRYMPAGFIAGCVISAVTLLGMFAIVLWRRAA